ncbi:MAG: 2Fe-2S iron-sulfur cluster-binding protein [Bacteroidota bacterium]
MAKITFIDADQNPIIAEGQSGSLMELAIKYKVNGIYADCGGVCSCATCHIHLPPEGMSLVGKASEMENDLLEFQEKRTEYSRLSCQIELSEDLDGMTVRVAYG